MESMEATNCVIDMVEMCLKWVNLSVELILRKRALKGFFWISF